MKVRLLASYFFWLSLAFCVSNFSVLKFAVTNTHTNQIKGVGDFSIDYCVDPNQKVQEDEV